MDLVVTHASADFDAFAAAMAARKLYAGATVVMTSGLARGVREFAALHRDRFPWLAPSDVDASAITRLIIVDVRRTSRLRAIPALLARAEQRELEVHVWDHHPASDDDVRADVLRVEPVGSATTLLIEAMRARGIEIDEVEATLFALGIHADTGSLQYASTTSRDAEALAHLLSRGASMRVMSRFLSVPFTEAQRVALASALDALETTRASGLRVAIAAVELDAPCEGLDEVASELFRLELPHALFLVATVPRRGRANVVARAREGTIDVASLLGAMGGGGHPTAASLSIRDTTGDALVHALREAIARHAPRPLRVTDVMRSPVRTITPDHPLARLRDELPSWRVSGVPVVNAGALVGIVSSDDVERAEREGRLHLAAGSCMSAPVRTVDACASVEEALDRMAQHRIGRLPVMRDGVLVGIVTRGDLRALLYG
ncbi:CBS domain-containing protein [Sandaracinus amylolyticus]|uniref:CBS domain-containing protein n=1 Tax=Sandaracinus amylolyticus TaxID=927083 RepID=UPI0014708342|nr:CBS domain-containing protein [Sandaracinus amylolyticus]